MKTFLVGLAFGMMIALLVILVLLVISISPVSAQESAQELIYDSRQIFHDGRARTMALVERDDNCFFISDAIEEFYFDDNGEMVTYLDGQSAIHLWNNSTVSEESTANLAVQDGQYVVSIQGVDPNDWIEWYYPLVFEVRDCKFESLYVLTQDAILETSPVLTLVESVDGFSLFISVGGHLYIGYEQDTPEVLPQQVPGTVLVNLIQDTLGVQILVSRPDGCYRFGMVELPRYDEGQVVIPEHNAELWTPSNVCPG